MNDLVGVIIFIIVVVGVLGRLILRVREALGRLGGGNPGASLTPVERSVQRELQKYLREHKAAPAPVAPDLRPAAPVAVQPAAVQTQPPPRPVVPPPSAPPRLAPQPPRNLPPPQPAARPGPARVCYPAPARRGPQAGQRRPLRLNPRVMARVAILSEIWRPPLALRQEQPWERS